MPSLDADYFDQWYADMTGSKILAAAKQRHLGLPPELMSTSALTFDGLREVADLLGLGPGSVLLDLACGRGGYGSWLARETGASVVGVDFSAVAIDQAREAAVRFGLAPEQATFRVRDLESTGLADASVDGVLCVDAVQFASSPAAALRECRRVLRPDGRVVLTCWEALDPTDESVPERLRRIDLDRQLREAGFVDVVVEERPGWREAERGYWEEAAACDAAGDSALQSWHDEGTRVLKNFGAVRRVLAAGRAQNMQNAFAWKP